LEAVKRIVRDLEKGWQALSLEALESTTDHLNKGLPASGSDRVIKQHIRRTGSFFTGVIRPSKETDSPRQARVAFQAERYADAFFNRGVANSYLKRYNEAVSDYTEAINLNPKYAEAFNNRGAANAELGDYEQAISDYDEVCSVAPQHPFFGEKLPRVWRYLRRSIL
jgi:tetratricopeptide (TPR) repeat protein